MQPFAVLTEIAARGGSMFVRSVHRRTAAAEEEESPQPQHSADVGGRAYGFISVEHLRLVSRSVGRVSQLSPVSAAEQLLIDISTHLVWSTRPVYRSVRVGDVTAQCPLTGSDCSAHASSPPSSPSLA